MNSFGEVPSGSRTSSPEPDPLCPSPSTPPTLFWVYMETRWETTVAGAVSDASDQGNDLSCKVII